MQKYDTALHSSRHELLLCFIIFRVPLADLPTVLSVFYTIVNHIAFQIFDFFPLIVHRKTVDFLFAFLYPASLLNKLSQ